MKKIISLLLAAVLLLCSTATVFAADGKVTYSGNAGSFIFEPGGEHSLTDLFPNFKSVMPGDTLTQRITVKNNADKEIKVKIYLRSLGAHEDSVDFLSQLGLKVAVSKDNDMAYMFDAAANETAQLSDWVYLGMLYSGGKVNLDVTLSVPVELSNEYQNKIGYLDWEFGIEEFPIDDTDPKPPEDTGDRSDMGLWLALMTCSLLMIIILVAWRKKDKEQEQNATKH